MMQGAQKTSDSAFFEVDGAKKLRAARAWLKWNVRDTGRHALVPHQYITYYENERLTLSAEDFSRLHAAFLEHGVKITASGLEAVEPAHAHPSLSSNEA